MDDGEKVIQEVLVGQGHLDLMRGEIAQILGIFFGLIKQSGTLLMGTVRSADGAVAWEIRGGILEDDKYPVLICNTEGRRIVDVEQVKKLPYDQIERVRRALPTLVEGLMEKKPGLRIDLETFRTASRREL